MALVPFTVAAATFRGGAGLGYTDKAELNNFSTYGTIQNHSIVVELYEKYQREGGTGDLDEYLQSLSSGFGHLDSQRLCRSTRSDSALSPTKQAQADARDEAAKKLQKLQEDQQAKMVHHSQETLPDGELPVTSGTQVM